MRFDDSLRTVLAADTSSAFGAQSAFRQLVDLLGRGRVAAEGEPLDRLRALRTQVPSAIRAASARSLALTDPPAALVALFAEDEPAVAAPVLRSARLADAEWLDLLPRIGPAGRASLRARDGLSATVVRGLAAFGSTDFTIGHDGPAPAPVIPLVTERPPEDARPIGQTFAIAELVERIETFHRDQAQPRPAATLTHTDRFSFETDAAGTIIWVEGAPRAGLVGTMLRDLAGGSTTIRLAGELAGEWAVSAVPLFTPATGRLAGYRGGARRTATAADQAIEPDALRRLVHELRTPTTAISGFAELISTAMLGPVAPVHRARADAIGRDVRALIGAIDDLEISARVDGGALKLSPRPIDLAAALATAVESAAPDGDIRVVAESGLGVLADDRALDRLLTRLAATVASSATGQATVTARAAQGGVAVTWPWPASESDASLLGADFALRLAHKLARALGGRIVTGSGRLTLHLPSSLNIPVQATTH